ncbi:type IV toxin-antitoxin system AbiEi family antitoxin [Thermococcus sp.]|uniref:type IV toxin-antitoxin system AbiEi family antitoxin domain-containing protein n=1 Tax=Thermococcus sp. TaxID=35749 RepID=UPI002638DFFE|nr:type IV toxin-antitoxin system AbiEi family antitoxin [Thermococcus sp.]
MNTTEVLRRLSELGDVFTKKEAQEKLGITTRQLSYYLEALLREGFLRRIAKGIYTFSLEPGRASSPHEFVLAQILVPNGAVAYWSALNYYGLTEQIPRTVFIQTPVKRGYQKLIVLDGKRFKVVVVSPEKFFGIGTIRLGRREIRITDPEKTIVDCLDKPKYCGGIIEVVKALKNARLDYEKLLEYAERMKSKAILKRLGFLSERLELGIEKEIRLSENDKKSFALLDPSMPQGGRFNYRWGLRINVPEDYWEEVE